MHSIFKKRFKELQDVLLEKGIFVSISQKLEDYIIDKSNYFNYGARTIRREIEQNIEDVIVNEMISKNIRSGDKISLDYVVNRGIVVKEKVNETLKI